MTRNVFRSAFAATLPVLMGYGTMGAAAGILLAKSLPGHAPFWGFLTSATSISGALQFMIAEWIRSPIGLFDIALLTFFLNIRYAMYGISLIERFQGIAFWKKCYLIWTLTDETYALEAAGKSPEGKDRVSWYLTVAALNHSYWIAGVTAGAVIGTALPFNSRGIDFAMTALFLVILTDQCRERKNRMPALAGLASAIAARFFFRTENMLIPAMIGMIALLLLLLRKRGGTAAERTVRS